MEQYVVGLDIGGTAVKGALINTAGDIVYQDSIATCHDFKNNGFVESLNEFILNLLRGNKIQALGVAIAGVLDSERTMLIESPNLPQLKNLPLQNLMLQRFHCPVIIENDANAAAFGELHFGSGRGCDNFLFFTLGTGIGSGVVLERSLWRGELGKAGEFGHVTVEPDGQLCGCGKKGCLEAYSSGTAIIRMARKAAANNPDTALHSYADDIASITPERVYQAALAGDGASRMIFKTMARGLAIAIADVNNLLDIHTFIIGGGISGACKFFVPMILEELEQRVFKISREKIKIVKAQLGNDAGVLGAGLLAGQKL